MGAIEQSIAKQAIRAGEALPDRIANAAELKPGLQLYLTAFYELDSERSHGLTLTPIPRSAIFGWAQDYGLDEEQTEDLLFLIRQMDNAHLARLDKKNKT